MLYYKKVRVFLLMVYFYFMVVWGIEVFYIIEIFKKEIVYLIGKVIVFMKFCNFSIGLVMCSYWLISECIII